jgi:hypothetical protein
MKVQQEYTLPAYAAAQEVLARYRATHNIIEVESADLRGLIETYQGAQQRLADAESAPGADAAKETADIKRARAAAEAAGQAIDQTSERLNRRRGKLATFAPELATAYGALLTEAPAFRRQLLDAFQPKWEAARAVWEQVLGHRAAVEALVGVLDLPQPSPAAVELPEALRGPSLATGELEAAVGELSKMARAARAPLVTLPGEPPYPVIGPREVFVVREDHYGLAPGTLVVAASLSEGRLASMVHHGAARPAVSKRVAHARNVAILAQQQIDKAKRDEAEAVRLAKQTELQKASETEQNRRTPGSTSRAALENAVRAHNAKASARGVSPDQ